MTDAIETLAIGLTITMIFSIPFAFFAYIRYLRYKETIALAERGLLRPSESRNGRGTLRWGVVLTFVGFALVLGLLPVGWFLADSDSPMMLGPWLLVGCLPLFFGLALLVIYALTRSDSPSSVTTGGDPADDAIPPHKQ
jgi:phosphoglycerol transferase MdoB-like AlkP superfamily enzyme